MVKQLTNEKGLGSQLLVSPLLMDNHMEKNMEHGVDPGTILGILGVISYV